MKIPRRLLWSYDDLQTEYGGGGEQRTLLRQMVKTMPAEIILLPLFEKSISQKKNTVTISTVAKSGHPWNQLSPFLLGPCRLYDGRMSQNMENGWQYSKVYKEHIKYNKKNQPYDIKMDYWHWAHNGWMNTRAVRYPMGKGKSPEFSFWKGECLDYVTARKVIYGPLYAEAVKTTEVWRQLKNLYKTKDRIVLFDYDVRDISRTGETLTEVLNNPNKKMGHAFVLAMILQNDKALNQMELR